MDAEIECANPGSAVRVVIESLGFLDTQFLPFMPECHRIVSGLSFTLVFCLQSSFLGERGEPLFWNRQEGLNVASPNP